jgi:DNA-binding SARP family transcriptional activator
MERDLLLALYCADGGTLSPLRLAALLWDRAVDAFRFERQVADGGREFRLERYTESAWTLGQALTLWRGAPLGDAGNRSFARAQIARLENTYRTAVITKLKADISLGQHREATGELEALTMTWPEDGEMWRLLVICLYRSERPIEAARACRQAIGVLVSQGLSDRHLQELQHDMLTGSLPTHGPVLAEKSRLVRSAS